MQANSKFPKILRSLLKEHNITHAEIAKKIGVKPNTISAYCNGKARPDIDSLMTLAAYFNVSTDFLLTGERFENKITREELGLSENALEVLKSIAQGETLEGLSGYLDSLICDKEFREAFYAAIAELQRNAIMYQSAKAMYDTEGKTLDFNDFMKFLEIRATQALQAPLQEYFKGVNLGRKAYRDTPNEYFGKTASGWTGDKPSNTLTNA